MAIRSNFSQLLQDGYGFSSSQKKFNIQNLVTFDGKGKYEEPKLVWAQSNGLTSLVFLDSDKLGTQYRYRNWRSVDLSEIKMTAVLNF